VLAVPKSTTFHPGTVLSLVKYQQDVAGLQLCRGGFGEAGVSTGISKSELNKIRPGGCANVDNVIKNNKKHNSIIILFLVMRNR
jgi:hypothetical protein